jgi:hypothetical protein
MAMALYPDAVKAMALCLDVAQGLLDAPVELPFAGSAGPLHHRRDYPDRDSAPKQQ